MFEVRQGDCVELMVAMPAGSVDAVVCDPPYGLEFMGKDWDRLDAGLPQENVWKGRRGKGGSTEGDPTERWAGEDGRSIPSGRTSYGGKRTPGKRCTHCGKRQFSGSPCECPDPEWVLEYPEGPPSGMVRMQRWHQAWATEALRVLKPGGHLLAFGGSRTYHRLVCAVEDAGFEIRDTVSWLYGSGFPKSLNVGNGFGTALKPAHEPVVVARKSLSGTVAGNVLEHGTGALNVDGCRVHGGPSNGGSHSGREGTRETVGNFGYDRAPIDRELAAGRWPANVVLDGEAARLLDEQTGELHSQDPRTRQHPGAGKFENQGASDGWRTERGAEGWYADTGGASRFFYCAKSSRGERNAGLEGFEERERRAYDGQFREKMTDPRMDRPQERRPAANGHPTVKPISLMRWLVRLVTPLGGTCLDPFCGSGTTGIASVLEAFDFIGLEREEEYVRIAEARIGWWHKHRGDGEAAEILAAGELRDEVEATGQLGMFD